MAQSIQETTLELDLKNGSRRFLITDDEDTKRYEIEVRCQYNAGQVGDLPDWKSCDHPALNEELKTQVLDLALALHSKPYSLSINDA